MRLILNMGRSLALVAVLGLTFLATGCGEPVTESTDTGSDNSTAAAPDTDLGQAAEEPTPATAPATETGDDEAGSNTGGGVEVPALDDETEATDG